jgi:hypothetical protein
MQDKQFQSAIIIIKYFILMMTPNSHHLIQISIVEEYSIFRTINLFTVYLYFAVCLFLNKNTRIIDVLGVIFFLNKAIKFMYTNRGCNSGENIFNIRKKSIFNDWSVSENQFNIVFNNKIYTIKNVSCWKKSQGGSIYNIKLLSQNI